MSRFPFLGAAAFGALLGLACVAQAAPRPNSKATGTTPTTASALRPTTLAISGGVSTSVQAASKGVDTWKSQLSTLWAAQSTHTGVKAVRVGKSAAPWTYCSAFKQAPHFGKWTLLDAWFEVVADAERVVLTLEDSTDPACVAHSVELVKRYKDKVWAWQIGAEVDLERDCAGDYARKACGAYPPSAYVDGVQAVLDGLKAAELTVPVALSPIAAWDAHGQTYAAGVVQEFQKRGMAAPAAWDVHLYEACSKYPANVSKAVKDLQSLWPGVPVWVSELGPQDCGNDDALATAIEGAVTTAATAGSPLVGIFALSDQGQVTYLAADSHLLRGASLQPTPQAAKLKAVAAYPAAP